MILLEKTTEQFIFVGGSAGIAGGSCSWPVQGTKDHVISLEQLSAKDRKDLHETIFSVSCLQIFGPEVGQKLFFDETMKQVVKDVLSGQNCLVYTYGITNSGKTHTIQGKENTSCCGAC